MSTQIAVFCDDPRLLLSAKQLAQSLNLRLIQSKTERLLLCVEESGLSLNLNEKNPPNSIRVDFVGGKARHRRVYGGGKSQLIAKAVGLKKYSHPIVYDVTAGLGNDAFVLACLGCRVTMIERVSVIAALVDDGLKRLYADPDFENIALTLIQTDAIHFLTNLTGDQLPDIIYLDPMFPERSKTALVKKEMRILKEIVGDDLDADQLLEIALNKAKKRVVVKRSKRAPHLCGREPDVIYAGKSCRFDVYTFASPTGER